MHFSAWYSGAKLRVHCAQVEGEAKPDIPIKQIIGIMVENCVLDTALWIDVAEPCLFRCHVAIKLLEANVQK